MVSSAISSIKHNITIGRCSIVCVYRNRFSCTIIWHHTISTVLCLIVDECFCGETLSRSVVVSNSPSSSVLS